MSSKENTKGDVRALHALVRYMREDRKLNRHTYSGPIPSDHIGQLHNVRPNILLPIETAIQRILPRCDYCEHKYRSWIAKQRYKHAILLPICYHVGVFKTTVL